MFGNAPLGPRPPLPYPPPRDGPKYPYFVKIKKGPTIVHSALCETYGLAEARVVLATCQLTLSADTIELLKDGNVLQKWMRSADRWYTAL